jgi:hypothetical protein
VAVDLVASLVERTSSRPCPWRVFSCVNEAFEEFASSACPEFDGSCRPRLDFENQSDDSRGLAGESVNGICGGPSRNVGSRGWDCGSGRTSLESVEESPVDFRRP